MTIDYRAASHQDVPAMAACRKSDPKMHTADPRMAAYFKGLHHPQHALPPRTGYVATEDGNVVGYIAGHLTTRHDCQGEVQYLFVVPEFRRQGVATELLGLMAAWFREHSAHKICVNVNDESPAAEPFYRSTGAHPLSPDKKYWYIWEDIGTRSEPLS
jgi:GNAT superfamily N-acetyltransferase